MNTYVVYKHTNLINQKSYIGITIHGENPNIRWQNGHGYYQNEKFFTDILQYGWNNFSHEILAKNLSEQEALQIEGALIIQYDTVNNGYNNSYGNSVHGPEARKKISQALIGIKRNPESINKQITTKIANSGNKAGIDFINHKNTQRVRCKETGDVFCSISEACRWCNSEKVRDCCLGKRAHAGKHPISQQLLSWEFVDKNTEVTIRYQEAASNTHKIKKIICIETNKIYDNASAASRDTNISTCNILRVCQGKRKTAGNLHWKYMEE